MGCIETETIFLMMGWRYETQQETDEKSKKESGKGEQTTQKPSR